MEGQVLVVLKACIRIADQPMLVQGYGTSQAPWLVFVAVFEALAHTASWAKTEKDAQKAAEGAAANHGGANEAQLHRLKAFLTSANKGNDQTQGYSA